MNHNNNNQSDNSSGSNHRHSSFTSPLGPNTAATTANGATSADGWDELDQPSAPANWQNVQDPVRQSLSALTKAIRTQSAGLLDLDRKLQAVVTHDSVGQMVDEAVRDLCSKQVIVQFTRYNNYWVVL